MKKRKIKTDAQIQVATATAEIMANIGQNAEFVNISGGNLPNIVGNCTGNSFIDTLLSIPAVMKVLNAENTALNKKPLTDEIADLSDATLKGLGNLKHTVAEKAVDAINK